MIWLFVAWLVGLYCGWFLWSPTPPWAINLHNNVRRWFKK